MGRYENKPRDERLCSGCLKVENEAHFLFECNSYSTLRDNFTNSISSIVPNDLKLNNDQKLIYLMTCEDKNSLRLACISYLYLIVLREGKLGQRRNLKSRLFKELNQPIDYTPKYTFKR